ncbi:LIM and calponin homology domains-containing protein 1 [Gastrophryne carolinensis]
MASPAAGAEVPGQPHDSPPEAACREAQSWIEQLTGRSFGDKDFRTGLENGILLCELLNAIKPGLIKKINRLPTPIAGLDNVTLFLRGCKELGLKESQLFDPGDLQDNSNKAAIRISDCNRKLRNVLVTFYWLGKAANSCASYSGSHLNLKEFESLLSQMRKENEDLESPKRSIRDSGYIDCWDSERSDSLSPPRHGRDDSFDSLDSFGSRSQQTPSPDVVLRGSSDGRGSDSESDLPHRRLPDIRKDDMSARRVSIGENKVVVPFNQYLPNKSNPTSYMPAPLRKKKIEKSWSTATSPSGGERPFSPKHPETIVEEQSAGQNGEDGVPRVAFIKGLLGKTTKHKEQFDQQEDDGKDQPPVSEDVEARKLKSLQKVGIKVMPAAKRYSSPKQFAEEHETPDIISRTEISPPTNEDSEEEEECKMPDIERDDLATRRARMNQPRVATPFNQYIGSYINKTKPSQDLCSTTTPSSPKLQEDKSKWQQQVQPVEKPIVLKENKIQRPVDNESDQEGEEKVPDIKRDDLAKRKTQGPFSQQKEPPVFGTASITKADLATWQRLKLSSDDSESLTATQTSSGGQTPNIDVNRAASDDFGRRKLSLQEKRARNKQKFVHFGPVTEIDQKRWDRLCIAKPEAGESNPNNEAGTDFACAKAVYSDSAPNVQIMDKDICKEDYSLQKDRSTPDPEKDDMMVRRISVGQRPPGVALTHFLPVPFSLQKTEEKPNSFQPKETKNSTSSLHMTTVTPNNAPQAHRDVRSDSPSNILQQNKPEEPTELKDDLTCQPICSAIENNPVCSQVQTHPPQEILEKADPELSRFSTRSSISDDTESMSMCDMRYEDEGSLLPHSRAHHEHLQFVNDLLKEEDDTWQDDLARWKTRRRSASQDLLKKEEERKKMERLLSGDVDFSERRKSIKTYKEIVEEKEQREKELHEAYKNAKTREEANLILQKYIERFTISEAVLERLAMPKILERSQSVEPGFLSTPDDPSLLKHLRQPLPSPKFTSTVEATISPTMESDFKASPGAASPTKSMTSKAVPMVTPKPYSQPKNTQHVLKTFKVDGKVSLNGETLNGTEEQKERESNEIQNFGPSLTRSQMFEGVARVDTTAAVVKSDVSSIELHLTRPNVQNTVKDEKVIFEGTNHNKAVDREDSAKDTRSVHAEQAAKEPTQPSNENKENTITSLAFTPSQAPPKTVVNGTDQGDEKKEELKPLPLDSSMQVEVILPSVQRTPEDSQEAARREQHGDAESSQSSAAVPLNPSNRFGPWDPEEERRRQERWQQEQERLLQERYQKEQEKLKEEWEKAQKEVEEEERKYYEEERKIIEDTVMPVTVSPATSQHRAMCDMNESIIPSQKEQETPSGEAWIEAQSCVKDTADDKPQVPMWTLNGALHRAEEQRKITNTSRTEETPITDKENDHKQPQQWCNKPTNLHLQFGGTLESSAAEEEKSLHNFVDNNSQQRSPSVESKGLDPQENHKDTGYSSLSSSQCQSPNRSVSGKKLCSTCGLPLGKGAAMIIETLSLYFHIQCFKCGICKGQLGDSTTGTDVRIRNGLLNCNDCYARSRTAGHPTPL